MSPTSSLEERWHDYFDDVARSDVQTLTEAYPDRRSLYVDLIDLHEYDAEFLRELFDAPDRVLSAGADALGDRSEAFGRVHVRVRNNPQRLAATGVRARHLHELVTVEALVESVESLDVRASLAVHACPACGGTVATTPRGLDLPTPARCDGCGWDGPFEFDRNRSRFVDGQTVELAAPPDERGGEIPNDGIDALLDDDIVGSVAVDDRCLVTGVVRTRGDTGRNRFGLYLDAVSVTETQGLTGADAEPDEIADVLESRWREDRAR